MRVDGNRSCGLIDAFPRYFSARHVELAGRMNEPNHPDELDHRLANRLADVWLSPVRRMRLMEAVQRLPSEVHGDGAAGMAASAPPLKRWRLRRWMTVRSWLAASAVVVLALVSYAMRPTAWDAISAAELARQAELGWTPQTPWQAFRLEDKDALTTLSTFMRETPRRWQRVDTGLDRQALVFEFAGRRASPAKLYAMRARGRIRGLPSRPPQQPQSARDGQCVAAWQEGDFVYVLMVDGSTAHYWDRIRNRGAEVARGGSGVPSG